MIQLTIKPSEAKIGDMIANFPMTNPTIRTVESWSTDGFVKITCCDGGVLNTYDHFPLTIVRMEKEEIVS